MQQYQIAFFFIIVIQLLMISPREEGIRKTAVSPRGTIKNSKLASLTANIANRSPINKDINLLASKKQLLQNKQKIVSNAYNQLNNHKPINTEFKQSDLIKVDNLQNIQNIKFTYGPQRVPSPLKTVLPPQIQANKKKISSSQTSKNNQLGQIISGKTINFSNGDKYEGDILSGERHGKGYYLFKNKNLKYQGQFLSGKQHGYGILINLSTNQPIYEGNWQYGMKNGEGRYTYDRDTFYNGEWINDQKHGVGIYNYEQGCYNGGWVKNKREGKGSLKLNNGTQFKGTFDDNYFVKGFVKYPNGDEYSGEMKNNRRHGEEGFYMEASTKIRYKGSWFNDKKHGKGTITYENGDELTGHFTDGNLNQQYEVKYKWRDGSIFNGWFHKNQPNKGTVSLTNGQKWQI